MFFTKQGSRQPATTTNIIESKRGEIEILMNGVLAPLKISLDECSDSSQLRSLSRIVPRPDGQIDVDGIRLINFASNDYLGLSQHPFLKRNAAAYLDAYGVGTASSRLLSGNICLYDRLEERLATLKGTEEALIFSTGFQANSTILSSLAQQGQLIASDRLNHSSIAQALRLSKTGWFRYAHLDLQDLESRLAAAESNSRLTKGGWIVTESLFSMDGDEIDLPAIRHLARSYNLSLYIDEAHSIGVSGPNGMGIKGERNSNDVYIGTFGKSCGSFGAYIACPRIMKDFLINSCPGLIYSTALPPSVLGAIEAALEIIPMMNAERSILHEKSAWLRHKLQALDMDTGASRSHIIPVIMGSNNRALHLSAFLRERGIFAPAVRTPTVPINQSRVRFSITASLTQEHLNRLVDALASYVGREDFVR